MNIILSIHPKWAKLIYEGKKTLEWKKKSLLAEATKLEKELKEYGNEKD